MYFVPYVKWRNNDTLRLIKKKFYSANKLTLAKLYRCVISRIAQSYSNVLFGAMLEKPVEKKALYPIYAKVPGVPKKTFSV